MEATPLTHNPMEAALTLTKLEESIQQAGSQYFRLVVLAGPPRSGKTTILQSISQKLGCVVVNVNLELSKSMLELTRTQRPRQVERLLKEVIAAVPGQVALLDNLEILFDASLQVEPLRLLQVSSRNRIIVASWIPSSPTSLVLRSNRQQCEA